MLVFGRPWTRVQRALVQIGSMNNASYLAAPLASVRRLRTGVQRTLAQAASMNHALYFAASFRLVEHFRTGVQRALGWVSMNDAFFCSDDLGDFCPVRVHEPRVQQCSTFSVGTYIDVRNREWRRFTLVLFRKSNRIIFGG